MATLEGKSVAVTGGAGFIGSHLIDAIVDKKPSRLVVIDNFFLGNRLNLGEAVSRFPKLEIVELDATDMEGMKRLLGSKSVDVVFDLATIPLPASLEKPLWSSKVILDLTCVLCELCRLGHFKTLIHCSSSEAYGSGQFLPMNEEHPLKITTPYGAAKAGAALMVEAYHQAFKIDMAIGRPFNNFGPRQNGRDFSGIIPRIIQRIMKGETPVVFGDGLQTRDYLYSTDTARGLILLYETEKARGQTINLATGIEISVLKIIEDVSRLMDWNKPPRFDAPRQADVRRHWAEVKRCQTILNFSPRVDWTEGIERTVRWYQKNPDRLTG